MIPKSRLAKGADTQRHLLEARKTRVQQQWRNIQQRLCHALEQINGPGARFIHTSWRRKQNGKAGDFGGGNMAMLHGRIIEKAGVHCSTVYGSLPKNFAAQIPGAENGKFWASGVSAIIHPKNPHAPTAHMNMRMICTQKMWFGGGADLTPMLPAARRKTHADSKAFHAALKQACDTHHSRYYARFAKACDTYFFLPHRHAARGTGGLFIDNFYSGNWEKDFAFLCDVAQAFIAVYTKILTRRVGMRFTPAQQAQQLKQRGRYVEFNLLYDRGTIFGLRTGGHIDAIMSSLPPRVEWP